jgi:methionine-rich copper-binding protein CopC
MKSFGKFIICSCLVLFLPAQPAQAHAQLVGSSPSAGEVLSVLPEEIRLSFDDPLIDINGKTGNEIVVTDEKGDEIQIGASKTDGTSVSVELTSESVTGPISVKWRVVAEDGHPEEGAFNFSVSNLAQVAPVNSALTKGEKKKEPSKSPLFFLILPLFLAAFIIIRRRRDQ